MYTSKVYCEELGLMYTFKTPKYNVGKDEGFNVCININVL